ncbi:hypothetical protein IJG20_00995 [Candidatus Saccharibacteria bacterium]|nr:hypothetical protein [Candidatus Saccharibacteria bacterium]
MKIKSNDVFNFLLAFTFSFYLSGVIAEEKEDKFAEIISHGVSQAKLLRSIQFEFSTEYSHIGSDYGFCSISGSKFHSRLDPVRLDDLLLPSENAYNGDKYQLLDRIEDGLGDYLSLSSSQIYATPSGTLDPLSLPYIWLFTSGQIEWSAVKDNATWENAFSKAEYLGTETVENHPCEVVRLPSVDPNMVNTVYFATDLNYFPVKLVASNSDGSTDDGSPGILQVVEYEQIDVDGEKLTIPTKLNFTNSRKDSEFYAVSSVNLDSLKVNQPIDDDEFTISPTRARRVIDLDEQRAVEERLMAGESNPAEFRYIFILRVVLICTGLFIIGLGLYMYIKKRNQSENTGSQNIGE